MCVEILVVKKLIQRSEGSLIRNHCSKTAALSSDREFPFEQERSVGGRREEERAEVRRVRRGSGGWENWWR